ncbi:TauD/TfdA family dioxygenase [Streptomyces sp. NPDC055239]
MRRSSADPFARHLVDVASPDAQDKIAGQLRERGLVTVTGLASRTAVLSFASRIMEIIPHRDSESDGLTTIRNTDQLAARPGFAGFGSGELAPHTERSGIPVPPRLMLLVCRQKATAGGESLLADGREVHTEIFQHSYEAGVALSTPRTAYFGAGDGHLAEIFTNHPEGDVSIRLRLDRLAQFNPTVQPYVSRLRSVICRHQLRLPLTAGQGYLLDNRRWLHARTAFTGDRVCWRALGEPHFSVPHGFTPKAQPIRLRRATASTTP